MREDTLRMLRNVHFEQQEVLGLAQQLHERRVKVDGQGGGGAIAALEHLKNNKESL